MEKRWSASHRVWHWFNALAVVAMVASGLLLKLGGELLDYFQTPHILIGFTVALLLIFRSVRALFFGDRATFEAARRLRSEAIRHLLEKGVPRTRQAFHLFHMAAVKNGYLGVYALLAGMAVTGVAMALSLQFGSFSGLFSTFKTIHEVLFVLLASFIPLHVAGVVVAELTDTPNIVSEMIHGGKR
jgi:cytochrome b